MNNDFERINLIDLGIFKTRLDSIDNKLVLAEMDSSNLQIEQKFIDGYSTESWHTYYEDGKFPLQMPECSRLHFEIENAVTKIIGKKMVISNIWSLTLHKGESVSLHSHKSNAHMHPVEYYSVAYYPSVPAGSSKLIFQVSWCNTMENLISISPEPGMLVIFNSYIQHMTNRHDSADRRVVISANLGPEQPNMTVVPDWSAYN